MILKKLIYLILLQILLLILIFEKSSQIPEGMTTIRNKHAYMGDKGLMKPFIDNCIFKRYSSTTQIPSSLSIEALIDFIDRLEDYLSNTTDPLLSKIKQPNDVARLMLQRFHLDDVDFNDLEFGSTVANRLDMDTKIIGTSKLFDYEYYFPDGIFKDDELCTLLFMFSHIFLNASNNQINNHYRRDIYHFDQSFNTNNNDIRVGINDYDYSQYPIQEKGLVSFRLDKEEAIAPAKVLIGILASLTKEYHLSSKDLDEYINPPIELKDPILSLTFANMLGTSLFLKDHNNKDFDDRLIFGVSGEWLNGTYNNHYVVKNQLNSLDSLRYSCRGSLAQIRGALDGYIIGKHLKKIDTNNLRLSTILRSYYSVPHLKSGKTFDIGVSYCDRSIEKPPSNDLNAEAEIYSQIFSDKYDKNNFDLVTDSFPSVLEKSIQTQSNFCRSKPTTQLDQNSPCETPSDLLFVVDGKQQNLLKSSQIIDDIIKNINKINQYSGTISIFFNSNTNKNIVQLPNGPGGWPLSALIFNSTNIGFASCAFGQNKMMFSSQSNFGKFFKELNETITNYRYWNNKRKSLNDQASINVIIIDHDTLKLSEESKDKNDYNDYGESLKYDNRDVQYFIISNNKKDFDKILQNKDNLISTTQTQIGTDIAKKICNNPAQIIYAQCHQNRSENEIMTKYITPGYKQQWAMYPEYFLKSFDIEFKIQSIDGSIKYCFDREFPPRTERTDYCKEIAAGVEETIKLSNPCKDRNVRSCDPFYFTIWGKERSTETPCKEIGCQSLDQIKFQIKHTGISCNSSMKLISTIILQIICIIFFIQRFNHFI